MEQIIITKPNGSIIPIASKRTATTIKSAKQTWDLLGNDVVNINVESPFPQTYGIGDRITAFGREYKLHRLPKVKKTGMHAFSYDLEFEGVQYDLMRATYDLTIDTTNNDLQDVQADTLTGDLNRFATVLIANANRVFPGVWMLGACPDTDTLTLTFGEMDNCLSVLQNLCLEDNFNVEFEIVQVGGVFTINFMDKVGQHFPYTFQFGHGKGLYSLERQNVDSSNIITRLKVFGSSSNITNKYRATRLCLPGCTKGQSYIEKPEAVAKYGIYEATKYFDKVKPTFNGKVTSVVESNVLQFVDENMFELTKKDENGDDLYMINGVKPKIHFNTGSLAGYEFDVHSYDHATNTFTLTQFKDENGYDFPSENFKIGLDEYKILDVALPNDPYVIDAENRLANDGDAYYDQNSQPKVQYGLSITKAYLQRFVSDGETVNIFTPGDYIPIKDADIDVDKSVRIKSLVRNLLDEYDYSLTISDTVSTNITNRVISELIDHDKIIAINNLKDPARARANWRSSREVMNMVFDPDGDYYTDKIKPNSIDTLALSIGAKSMQFGLTNTVLQPNYNGNKNVIKVTGGVLTHYTINKDSARFWELADNTTEFLVSIPDKTLDQTPYYIYAKCERSGTAGSIIFTPDQIQVEQDVNEYHFLIGVVNSVDPDLQVRSVALSYGFTMVNGRFIKTGRIESADGLTYFDLDNNQFRMGDSFSVIAWNENNDGKLRLKGTLVQSQSGDEQPLGCFRGVYNSYTTYYKGDEVTYQGSTYRYINNVHGNVLPTTITHWTVIVSKGDDGANGTDGAYFEYRYAKNGSTTTPPKLSTTTANPSGWTTTMPSVGTLEYLWITVAKKSAAGVLLQNWSTPVRTSGVTGDKGDTGAKGDKGDKGVPGTPGSNGQTYYTWIKYADTSTGGGISNDPTNKTYIGFAYNKTTATESNTPADYTWSLIKGSKGDTGVQGAPGSNGQTYYTWIKYSDNADGTGLYDVPNANTKYIGIAVNKTTATESSVKTDYTWSRFKGDTGATGDKGDKGDSPALVFRGEYSSSITHYGTSTRVDCVKYNGNYYVARVDVGGGFSGIIPTNTNYWNTFGVQFDSIATGLLLAENANIAGWVFRNNRLESQNGAAYLDGTTGRVRFANGNFEVDSFGNISMSGDFVGKIATSKNGNRVEISSEDNFIRMYNNINGTDCKVLEIGWDDVGFGIMRPKIEMLELASNLSVMASLIISPFEMGYYRYGDKNTPFFEITGGWSSKKIKIGSLALPTSSSGLSSGQLWRDGSTLKIVP